MLHYIWLQILIDVFAFVDGSMWNCNCVPPFAGISINSAIDGFDVQRFVCIFQAY